jgi:hypothetical protein
MALIRIAEPKDYMYSKNPIVYAWETDHYAAYNARMVMEILMDFGSGMEPIGTIEKRPDKNNRYVFNISDILDSAIIEYDMLALSEMNWDNPLKKVNKTLREYTVRVVEYYNNPEETDDTEPAIRKYVIKGGLTHEVFPNLEPWFKEYLAQTNQFLTWLPQKSIINQTQPVTLFFFNYSDTPYTDLKAEFKIAYYDPSTNTNSTTLLTKATGTILDPGQIIILPVHPKAAGLFLLDPSLIITEFTVTLLNEDTVVSETRIFQIDYTPRLHEKNFAYLNSLGGIDHIRCTGKVEPKIEFTSGNAERDPQLNIDYQGEVGYADYDAQIGLKTEFNQSDWESMHVVSGPKTHLEVECFRDFRLSPLKFEYIHVPSSRYLPIIMDQKNYTLPKTGNYPFYYSFNYKYAFQNRVFTPGKSLKLL